MTRLAVFAVLLLAATPAVAQQAGGAAGTYPNGLPTLTQLIDDITRAEVDMNGTLLIYSYGQSVRDPGLALGALSHLMSDYYTLRSRSTSAMQASQAVDETLLRFAVLQTAQNQVAVQQNQRIIEQNEQLIKQNQRMIDLLERMAPKPAPTPTPPTH